ncbi:MAG: hypothetical protein ACRCTR_03890 [Actinomycetota bacterium]
MSHCEQCGATVPRDTASSATGRVLCPAHLRELAESSTIATAIANNPGDVVAGTGQAIASRHYLGATEQDYLYQRQLSAKIAATQGRWAKFRTWLIG